MSFNIFVIFFGIGILSVVSSILNWFLVIGGIGFLIFIHELGHFLVAKYEGVRVEAFALGFGNALFKKRWGETDYRINMIPLGGYVKMAGDFPGENTGESDEFFSKKPGQRARILAAGVIMNALFGFLGMVIAFHVGSKFMVAKVGIVQPGSPAWQADLQKGDTILEVDGNKVYSFSDLFVEVAFSNSEQGTALKIERNGKLEDIKVYPKYDENKGISTIGIYPPMLPTMKVKEDTIPYETGFRSGDIIVEVTDINKKSTNPEEATVKVNDGYEIEIAISQMIDSNLEVKVKRGEEYKTFTLQPEQYAVHRIGIRPRFLKIGMLKTQFVSPFLPEDEIVKLNGKTLYNKEMLEKELEIICAEQAPTMPQFTIIRNGQEEIIDFKVDNANDFVSNIHFTTDLYVGHIEEGYPAQEHLQPGDKLVKINGQTLGGWSDIYNAVQKSGGKSFSATYMREGIEYTADIQAREVNIPVLELSYELKTIKSSSFAESCALGWLHTKNMAKHILLMLRGLANRSVSSKTLGGPVTIFAASHSYLELGMGRFIYFLALVSINLAIINLLPIPVLDGGHLVLIAAEKINGKPISEKVLVWINYAGFLFLLSLIIYVTINDVSRVFGG